MRQQGVYNMYVFSTTKFFESKATGDVEIYDIDSWVYGCSGVAVNMNHGSTGEMEYRGNIIGVHKNWCVEIPDNNEFELRLYQFYKHAGLEEYICFEEYYRYAEQAIESYKQE